MTAGTADPRPRRARRRVEVVRADYNGRRLHAGIGYVTPDDEHAGRGAAVRQARRDGLARARVARLAYHRNPNNRNQP